VGEQDYVIVEHPYARQLEGLAIYCPSHGLLHWEKPTAYISSLVSNVSIAGAQKKVVVPGAKGASGEEYHVQEVDDAKPIVVGSVAGSSVPTRLLEAWSDRERGLLATQMGQKWFHGDQREAIAFVREIVGTARHQVFIVDPYFAGRELVSFGHAVTRPKILFQILTSAKALKASDPMSSGKQCGEVLYLLMQNFDPRRPEGSLEIRVMPGNRSPIHDRFLVIDDDVWFSGNSLNSIGESASMMIRLPDPEPVVAYLQAQFSSAKTLSEWMKHRRRA
jgi:hypothetical protein